MHRIGATATVTVVNVLPQNSRATDMLCGLTKDQLHAVTTPSHPLCLLAGAGSGKTRVLTRRIGYRIQNNDIDPRQVLALTFTRKAADELLQRLHVFGLRDNVTSGTFHSIALQQLKIRWAHRGVIPPTVLQSKIGFLQPLSPKSSSQSQGNSDTSQLFEISAEIEWAKARNISPDAYTKEHASQHRVTQLPGWQIATVFDAYENKKRQKRVMDLDDILLFLTRDLLRDHEFRTTQQWKFRHFFVDEFQDVNPLQFNLLQAWIGERVDLCVVGDPFQAIYTWNGADTSYLQNFSTFFPGSETFVLQDNFRSSPEIIALANTTLLGASAQKRYVEQNTASSTKISEQIGIVLRANQPKNYIPEIIVSETEEDEAKVLIKKLLTEYNNDPHWSHQAILVRTNAQIAILEALLKKNSIPVKNTSNKGFFNQPEIKYVIAQLEKTTGLFAPCIVDIENEIRSLPIGQVVEPVILHENQAVFQEHYFIMPDEAQNISNLVASLSAFISLGNNFLTDKPEASVTDFLFWLQESSKQDQLAQTKDGIDLLTFHTAKGLEWPIVTIIGMEKGYSPIYHAQTPQQLAEERRLFYVAITRAQEKLTFFWCKNRTIGTRKNTRERSHYLNEIENTIDALQHGIDPMHWEEIVHWGTSEKSYSNSESPEFDKKIVREAELLKMREDLFKQHLIPSHKLRSDSSTRLPNDQVITDKEIYDALSSWRSQQAKIALIDPPSIFSDQTLNELSIKRPKDLEELTHIFGLGPIKIQRFGQILLDQIAQATKLLNQ